MLACFTSTLVTVTMATINASLFYIYPSNCRHLLPMLTCSTSHLLTASNYNLCLLILSLINLSLIVINGYLFNHLLIVSNNYQCLLVLLLTY